MNEKPTGCFSKVKKLITVLRKCNGKAVVGDSSALISPKAAKVLAYCGLLALMGALYTGAYLVQPYIGDFIGIRSLTQTLMLVLLIMSFVLSVKDVVTVLYTADDLDLLLPMPFSAGQIVLAKLAVISVFPISTSLILLNSVCLGYGIRAGAGAQFVSGILLSSVLIPVTGIAAAVLLIVILFRLFGFIRNRDITVAVGGICTFAFTLVHIFLNNSLNGEGSDKAQATLGILSSVSSAFPNISYMNRFLFEGSFIGLLVGVAVPLVLIMLAALAVRAFYFDTALSMQSTSVGKRKVSKGMLYNGKKNSGLKALTAYEAKSARRNPAYMIYGFAISFLWPVLFILPLILGNKSIFTQVKVPLDTIPALLAYMSFAAMASCFSCGFNILAGTAFSREGSSFSAIRSLPVDLTEYCKSKRNFALLICSWGSGLYVAAAGIVAVVAGFIPAKCCWMIPVGVCFSLLLDLLLIDLMLLKNSKKPQFNWESETELSRKLGAVNIIAIVAGVVMLIVFMGALTLGSMFSHPAAARIVLIICAAVGLAVLFLAPAFNRFAVKRAAKNLMKLE